MNGIEIAIGRRIYATWNVQQTKNSSSIPTFGIYIMKSVSLFLLTFVPLNTLFLNTLYSLPF